MNTYINMLNKKIIPLVAVLLLMAAPASAVVSMPQFALPSAVDGQAVSSDTVKGKVLLVTFFATWCPPCMQEIPTLIKLQDELKAKNFSVVGLSVDGGGAKVVAKLVKRQKINYPVLMANAQVAQKFGGIPGIPTSFLVNRQGNIVKSYPGYVPHKLLKRDIEAIME